MPFIEHETSPAYAADVAIKGRFLAGPILGDSGMNAVIVNHPAGPYFPGQAVQRGAVLRFDWTGPIVPAANKILGYPPNELQDEHPHRALVPVGTNQYLHLVDIRLIRRASWEEAVVEPTFSSLALLSWLASKLPGWKTHQAKRLSQHIAGIVAKRPLISVWFPDGCIYRGTVMKQYPNHNWPG